MPGKAIRRIMRHGSSGVVAIPPDFRRYYNLKHGEEVIMFYDSLIIIIPRKSEELLKDPKKRWLIEKLLE